MDWLFIFGAEHLYILSVLIYLVLLLRAKDRKRFLIFSISVFALSYLIAVTARFIHFNPQPFIESDFTPLIPHEADNSFVSDHTLLTASIAAIISHFKRRPALYLWLIAIAVGLSRMYVGVHRLTDIVASIIIAIIASLVVRFIFRKRRMI